MRQQTLCPLIQNWSVTMQRQHTLYQLKQLGGLFPQNMSGKFNQIKVLSMYLKVLYFIVIYS